MLMSFTDWVGFIGVSLILIGFFLNLKGVIGTNHILYILLNLVGASLACLASLLMQYVPFIILEGVWTIVSFNALMKYRKGASLAS